MDKQVIVGGKLYAPHTRNDSLAKVKIIPNKEVKKEKETSIEPPLNNFKKTRKSVVREISLK